MSEHKAKPVIPDATAMAAVTALNIFNLIEEGVNEAVNVINKASRKGLYTTTLYYGNSFEIIRGIAAQLKTHGYDAEPRCINGIHFVDISWTKTKKN